MVRSNNKVVFWGIPNESRQVVFLYNKFMSHRRLGEKYRIRKDGFVGHEKMASTLDDITAEVARNPRSYDCDVLEEMLKELGIRYDVKLFSDPRRVKEYMSKVFINQTIPNELFDWIDVGNAELCNFAWTYLMSSDIADGCFVNLQSIFLGGSEGIGLRKKISRSIKSHIDLVSQHTINTKNNQGKRDFIVSYFDLLSEFELSNKAGYEPISLFDINLEFESSRREDDLDGHSEIVNSKITLLHDLQRKWEAVRNDIKMNDWLVKNEGMAKWAYEYIEKIFLLGERPDWLDISANDEGEREGKYAVAVKMIYWLLGLEQKIILLESIRKSGTQQKYRIKNAGKKSSTFMLDEKYKEMLKHISSRQGKSQTEIVEALIEKAYEGLH
ncbi:hypothetical protein ABHF91_13620 [Pseudaeromonas sp. ZJS20]|uniref:hypothetical protein n=1 Tax=Pseudaeromonas aegiceratis TaxID=3153928 RepID=UPI00390C792F